MTAAARPRRVRRAPPPALSLAERIARADPLARQALARVTQGFPPTFRAWNERVRPELRWDWPHVGVLQHTVDRLAAGVVDRVIIQVPVRHGKSETMTVGAPAHLLDEDPARRFIVASYNVTLAAKFGRKIRRLARQAGVPLSDERNAADDWETTAGGGVRAVGVGAGITGQGGDGIFVDDPIKSRAEAESATYREAVWEWFTSDLLTRLEPGGFVVLTMSRWHEDDLTGRILASEDADRWHVINLPALAEPGDPLGRDVGAALCPDRFDEQALADIRLAIGEYAFASLYQQHPQPRNAGMFPPGRVTILPAEPAGVTWLRWWDFGGTAGGGDPTAGARVGLKAGRVIIADVASVRLEAAERDRFIRATAEMDGRAVTQWGEQEPGSGGKAQAQAFVRLLAGWPVHTEPTRGDKATAMDPLAAQWQAGNVDLVAGPWNRAFLDQAAAAPFGRHEDMIEAAARAFNKLAAPKPASRPYVSTSSLTLR